MSAAPSSQNKGEEKEDKKGKARVWPDPTSKEFFAPARRRAPSPTSPSRREPSEEDAGTLAASPATTTTTMPPRARGASSSVPPPDEDQYPNNEAPNEVPPPSLAVAVEVDTSGVDTAVPVVFATLNDDDNNNFDDDDDVQSDDEDEGNDKDKATNRWRRRRLLLGTAGMVVVAALVVGLSVGLTLASKNRTTAVGPPPVPAGDPTQLTADARCYGPYGALDSCFGGNNSSRTWECGRCVAAYYTSALQLKIGDVYNTSCVAIDNETCDALASCSDACDTCEQEFITYFECASLCSLTGTSCKATRVPTVSPRPTSTPKPTLSAQLACSDEYDAFSQCAGRNQTGTECERCVADRLSVGGPNFSGGCPALNQMVCKMVDGCPVCGECVDKYLDFLECKVPEACRPFNCASPTI